MGISQKVVDELMDTLTDEEISSLHGNKCDVIKMISFFRDINLNSIEEILIYYPDIFLVRFDVIYDKFNKFGIEKCKDELNADYNAITKICNFYE